MQISYFFPPEKKKQPTARRCWIVRTRLSTMTSSFADPVMGKNSDPKVTVTAEGPECSAWMTEPDTLYKYLQYHFSFCFIIFCSFCLFSLHRCGFFCFGQSSVFARFISIFVLAWTTTTTRRNTMTLNWINRKRTDLRRRTFHNWPRPMSPLCWPTDRSRPTESKNMDPELIALDAVTSAAYMYIKTWSIFIPRFFRIFHRQSGLHGRKNDGRRIVLAQELFHLRFVQ